MICDRRWVVLLLWTFFDGVDSSITRRPEDTEVRIGDSTYLNCSFSDASAPKFWYHYPVGKGSNDMKYVFVDHLYPPYNERFRIDATSSHGAFNLVMDRVESQDAGQYVCQNNGDPSTAQLIVLESTPRCMSNINSNDLIGPNSCGLEKETIQLSCVVSYSGNIPPKLQWTRVKNGQASPPINDSLLSCVPSDGRITCNYTVEADIELNGAHFVCQTSRATNTQYNCSTESVKILYSIENKTRVEKSVGDEVSCPIANTSSSDCSYTWIWFDGDREETVSKNSTLVIDREGLHRCEARCSIKDFVCEVSTTLIKASSAPGVPTIDTTRCIIIACTVGASLIVLFVLMIGLYWKFCRKATKKTLDERDVVVTILSTTGDKAEINKLRTELIAKNNEVDDLKVVIKSKEMDIEHLRNQDKAEINKLRTELIAKNNEVDDLRVVIKSKEMDIEHLRNQATRPATSRRLLVSAGIKDMATCSGDDQPSTSNGCDDQTEWTCKKCTWRNTGQNCQICDQRRES